MASTLQSVQLYKSNRMAHVETTTTTPTTTAKMGTSELPRTQEERAQMIANVMQSRRGSHIGQVLAERASLISSVKWLGNHVPVCVLNRLGEEIKLRRSRIEADVDVDDSIQFGVGDETSEDESDQSSFDFSEAMVLTQDLLTEMHKEERGAPRRRGKFEEEEPAERRQSFLGGLAPLSEDDDDASIEYREILMPESRVSRRRSSAGYGQRRRESYQSFGEISELSLDWDDSEDDSSGGPPPTTKARRRGSMESVSENEPLKSTVESRRSTLSEEEVFVDDFALPHTSTHESALLFVDISGFTRLSTLLDPEDLSSVINAYFEKITNLVTAHGGDVLKFAGDAIFAEWQISSQHSSQPVLPHSTHTRRSASLAECVANAATCGAKIVHKCSDYPVYQNGESGKNGKGEVIATLDVHCGLGAGQTVGVHVGDATRREYLMLGTPIDQVAIAAEYASYGELHASPEALEIMLKGCQLLETADSSELMSSSKPVLIARKNLAGFAPKVPRQQRRCSVTHLWEGWDTELLHDYRELICTYAHPVVVENELHSGHQLRLATSTAKCRQVEEAEIRSVFVIFISMPQIDCSVGESIEEDKALFELLNNIMNLCTRELERFKGHLRQFIVDDKGLVLIATFGLRGSTSPNLVAERALPATMVIHNALQNELNVYNRIGATVGNTYCGVVGGVKRHEYAVMGPSVNLAARLMCSPRNPGILVSEAVRVKAGKVFAFNALPPVTAKGYSLPVPIFQPLSSLERRWGKNTTEFVGRTQEVSDMLYLAKECLRPQSFARLAFLTADSGTGKTTLVVHVIEQIKKVMHKARKSHRIAKHVCRESDVLVPLSIFRSILPDMLQNFEMSNDERTFTSGSRSAATKDSLELDWDTTSRFSMKSKSSMSNQSTVSSSGRVSQLKKVVSELDAPPEFVDLLGHLGFESVQAENARTGKKNPNLASSINYLVKLFQRWTRQAQITVLALDDVHLMDAVSWQVVQRLLDSVRNLFIVCTSRPLTDYKLAIDEKFWKELNSRYEHEGRFSHIELKRLGQDDIKSMIAKRFNLDEKEIDETFHRDVFNQSGGMPAFANEILQSATRRNSIGRQVDNRMGWTREDRGKGELTRASVGDMIVHRLDTFDQLVRTLLNLAAVLGASFELRDIVNVTHRFANTAIDVRAEHSMKIQQSLDFLVKEGILLEVCMGGDIDEDISVQFVGNEGQFENSLSNLSEFQDKTYSFCHDVWRSSILNLMLDSRKKQIHRIIATSLETQARNGKVDYVSQTKLWNHWKAAEDTSKASAVSLIIGKSFHELGMHEQSIKLFEDTLELWKQQGGGAADGVGGFSAQVLKSMNRADLECVIKVHIALGKDLANIHKGSDSVVAYQNALQIMQAAPSARYIRDRSIVFPIFSGLFLALKFGQIEQDEECIYEQNLVRRFVSETRLHGDPVHYTRALSMQAEMYGRLQDFPSAFAAFEQLKENYDAEKLTAEICKHYGSDRSAQCYSLSTLWNLQQNDLYVAKETCDYIFHHLMPKMDLKNVHNSAIMLYPTIWVMKGLGLYMEMLEIFVNYVVEPFDEHLGEGAFTFCLPVYDPIMMLLDLCDTEEGECENFEDFVAWALEEENLRFGTVINCSLGGFGRDCNSIAAEICLLLASRDEFNHGTMRETQEKLVTNGLVIARESMDFTIDKKMHAAQLQVEPVLEELEELAEQLNLDIK